MKRRLLTCVLIFVLMFLVACSSNKPNTGSDNQNIIVDNNENGNENNNQENGTEGDNVGDNGTQDENQGDGTEGDGTEGEGSEGEGSEGDTDQPADDVFNDETQEEPEILFSHIYTIEIMDTMMYAVKDVNIRSLPSTDGEILGRLLVNENIHVVGKCVENGWYKVEYKEGYAFIHYDYLALSKVTVSNSRYSWVADLDVAATTNQLIIVSATDTYANVGMYKKSSNGVWTEIFYTTEGRIGRNGLGKQQEGDGKTPVGTFRFIKAFGTKENPGTSLEYTLINESHYWIDDPNSAYYNQFVSTDNVTKDWESAEHLTEYGQWYYYCLALDYNLSREPGKGSAIFLHCTWNGTTSGCIAIPETYMIEVLKNVNEDCVIIIDTPDGVKKY